MHAPQHVYSADQRGHVPALDGLRGLAACMVVVSHISNQSNLWDDMFGAGGGLIGVMLFFVLSGYLMGRLYLDRHLTLPSLRGYIVHRLARVLPLFYAAAFAAVAFSAIGYPLYEVDDALRLLLLIDGSDIFWTIPIELHFYVIFIGVWAAFSLWPRATLLTASALAAWIILSGVPQELGSVRILHWIPFFFSGMLISRLRLRSVAHKWWLLPMAASFPLMFVLYPVITGIVVYNDADAMFRGAMFGGWHRMACLVAVAGCLVATLNVGPVSAFFSLRPMRFLGRISYSLYLLHAPIVAALWATHAIRGFGFLIVAMTAAICVASLSYRYIEAPARRLINERFGARLVTAQALVH